MTAGSSSVPKRPVRLVGTARTAVPGVPGVCLKLQGKSVFPWERLTSMRATVGPYSPERIGNSRTVPAVLTRYLRFYLQSSQVTHRARPLSRVTRQIAPPDKPAVPARPSLAVVRTDAKILVRPGSPFRYCCPSRLDLKVDGLDAWAHWVTVVIDRLATAIRYMQSQPITDRAHP